MNSDGSSHVLTGIDLRRRCFISFTKNEQRFLINSNGSSHVLTGIGLRRRCFISFTKNEQELLINSNSLSHVLIGIGLKRRCFISFSNNGLGLLKIVYLVWTDVKEVTPLMFPFGILKRTPYRVI